MQLPIDIRMVVEEATNIEQAKNTPLSVSVYLDDTAPGDVQAHVRRAFASASAHARVSLLYLDGRPFVPYDGDDMAVIVAGFNEKVGSYANQLRSAGVPVMVVTSMPTLVGELAASQGTPIPDGDLLSPEPPLRATRRARKALQIEEVATERANGEHLHGVVRGFASTVATVSHVVNQRALDAGAMETDEEAMEEPIVVNDVASESLSGRMGCWVVETCKAKRLAFALAFPFARKPLALDTVKATSLQNGGVGVVMFVPGADMPVMTLNQAKMLMLIAAAYGEPMGIERAKELAAVVAGGFACRSVARQILGVVPVGGWAVKGIIGYTGTLAMGHAAIDYFEGDKSFRKYTDVLADARNKLIVNVASKAARKAQASGGQVVANIYEQVTKAARGGAKKEQTEGEC